MSPGVCGYVRADGRLGARNHLLVLPSVVCATRVARDVAAASGSITLVHQLGCSQVGDDAARTARAFEGLATNPNIGAVVVISLGCETLQGRRLAERLEALGQHTAFVGIQDAGGSERAADNGRRAAADIAAKLAGLRRSAAEPSQLVIGIEAPEPTARVQELCEHALRAGAAVVAGDSAIAGLPWARSAARVPAFERFEAGPGLTVVEGAGHGPQQHVALGVAGAAIIVSFTGADDAPVGLPVCPVIAVAGDSTLHRALEADFDVPSGADVTEMWEEVLRVLAGGSAKAEQWGAETFALERLAMTL